MKKMIMDALISSIGGTEFDDGGKSVSVNLEDGYSFRLNPNSPLLKKLSEGRTIDFEYNGVKEVPGNNGFVYNNLYGVRVTGIKESSVATQFADIPDTNDTIIFRRPKSSGTSAEGKDDAGKM